MTDKAKFNPHIHKRKSIRLRGFDYSRDALYFITICTREHECLFGQISNGKMLLNESGKIADQCWLAIPDHYPRVILHEHIIMPNHIHGIIELKDSGISSPNHNSSFVGAEYFQPSTTSNETGSPTEIRAENIQPLQVQAQYQKVASGSIGAIVRGYKTGVTKWHRNNSTIHKVWQRNYHEHIIRNAHSHQRIADYIISNPSNWKQDKFFNAK